MAIKKISNENDCDCEYALQNIYDSDGDYQYVALYYCKKCLCLVKRYYNDEDIYATEPEEQKELIHITKEMSED